MNQNKGLDVLNTEKVEWRIRKKKIQIKKQLKHWDLKKNIAYFI